jgi:hypothetical protein
MRLAKISAGDFARFAEARFGATGISPDPDLGAAIVELAGNLPYDVQRLAHELWDDTRAEGEQRAGFARPGTRSASGDPESRPLV